MATGHEAFRAMFTASHGPASQSSPGTQAHGTMQGTDGEGTVCPTPRTVLDPGQDDFRAMFTASHGSSTPGAETHGTMQGTAGGGAVSASPSRGACEERGLAGSEGGRILVEDEGQEPQHIDGGPPGDEYNTLALRTQLNAVPLAGRTIDDVTADVKAVFQQHGVLMVVSTSKKIAISMGVPVEQRAVFDVDNTGGYWLTVGLFAVELDGTFVSGRLYKKTLACQRAFSIRQKKDDSTLTVNERRRRTRHERCRCAVSILHPQSAQHPKLSSITLEHNHPIDKAEVEAKLAQKAWQAAKYQFLAAFPSPFQPWKSLEQAQLLQPPLSSQLLQPLQLLSLPHQHAKKRRISESALGIPTMGVDIRIPAGWQVESKFVQGKKCIGTHNGSFHCDEALACAMLKLLPEWSDAVVVRTRDATELAKCEVVVDVGGIYDPESLRFDHHQKIFRDTLSEESFGTRLSSAGLVYKHFGHRILKLLVEGSGIPSNMVEKKLYEKVYKNFMEHIDAIDNGVDVASGPLKYDVSSHLSARVARLNPRWNEPTDPSGPAGPNHRFMMAMSLTGGELCEYVRGLAESWWPAREIVADSLARREEYHPSGEIVVLSRYCPWKGHLLELEEEMGIAGKLKFVIYAEGINADSKWRIQAIPQAEDSLTFRLSLAKPWLGLRDDELSAESNIPGCIFVHVNGFIGENATKAGALAMAIKSLEMVESTA